MSGKYKIRKMKQSRLAGKPHSRVEPFDRDILENAGYRYTTNARLSSLLSNRRQTDAALAIADFRNLRIIDIGCGDGTYTIELFDLGKPKSMSGVDLSAEAVRVARQKCGGRNITFLVGSAADIPCEDDSFDVAHMRGVLHHMEKPQETLKEAFRVASRLIVIEPNGYNPVLKLIERFSKYHVGHGERSYRPEDLARWVRDKGGILTKRRWFGLVPFFCPDWFARSMKRIEPMVEGLPLFRFFACGSYIFLAKRRGNA